VFALVTPHLLVSDERSFLDGVLYPETVDEAVSVMRSGGTAQLPAGAWDMAADVLRDFGCDEQYIAMRIRFAQTNKIAQ
jgi:hypothetical protein